MDELLDAINPDDSLIPRLGVLGIDLTDNLRSRLNLRISSGVVVAGRAVDLIMPDTGLQAGDVIHSLNSTSIDSMDNLRAAVEKLKTADPVVMQIERSDGLMYVSFEME
jgi:S1-C subfamily serine protease